AALPEADEREVALHRGLDVGDAVELGVEAQVLAGVEAAVETGALGEDADGGADAVVVDAELVALDPGAPMAGRDERGQHPQRGRLAGAVGSEQPEHLALLDLERELADRDLVAEALPEGLGADHGGSIAQAVEAVH